MFGKKKAEAKDAPSCCCGRAEEANAEATCCGEKVDDVLLCATVFELSTVLKILLFDVTAFAKRFATCGIHETICHLFAPYTYPYTARF